MSKEDIAVIICATKDGMSVPPVPSQTCWCSVCAVEMWLSNTMVRAMTTLTVPTPMCIDCAEGVMATQMEAEVKLLPEQEPELAEAGVLDAMRSFVKYMNRKR